PGRLHRRRTATAGRTAPRAGEPTLGLRRLAGIPPRIYRNQLPRAAEQFRRGSLGRPPPGPRLAPPLSTTRTRDSPSGSGRRRGRLVVGGESSGGGDLLREDSGQLTK